MKDEAFTGGMMNVPKIAPQRQVFKVSGNIKKQLEAEYAPKGEEDLIKGGGKDKKWLWVILMAVIVLLIIGAYFYMK